MKSVIVSTLLVITVGLFSTIARGEPFRKQITNSMKNLNKKQWSISSEKVTPDCKIPWSVTKQTLQGGKQQGVELITIDNGKLQITVIPTRGMGILDVRLGDIRLGWDSPVKEVVHPQYVNLESRGGLGWLGGFNEWMVRCGLEFAGGPGEDKFINNVGDEATMNLTLHGKIANIPASQVEVVVDREAPYRIRVRGIVHERLFFGPNLKLVAEISTEPGSDSLRIDDWVTNQGALDQEFTVIYHTNYGRPILEEGSEVITATKRVIPMNDHAAKDVLSYARYSGPTDGYIEQVYLLEPLADDSGKAHVLLKNGKADQATSISWNVSELPYLTVWKNTAAKETGYVTGLEPGTTYPYNRRIEREAGRLPKLSPGETRRFTLDFGIHVGAKSVARHVNRIQAIQQQAPQIDKTPAGTD